MILAVYTNSDDVTADYICDKKPDWVKIIRFNTDVPFPIILSNDAKQLLRTIDVLWYRRPFENEILLDEIEDKVRFSENEEAVWNYLLQIPQKKWVNYPVNNWLAEKKINQLIQAKKYGLYTPDWILTNDDKTAVEFLNRYSWDCIIKPINSGYFTNNDKVYHIYTNATVKEKINLSILHKCPAFFQQRIEKLFDVRTVYVNGNTIYVRILGGGLDVRRNEMEGLKYDLVEPPDDVAFAYNKLIDSYSLRFCTSDFVVTGENKWVFLENNPNGQWVWMDEQLHGELLTFFYNNLRNIREYE